MSSQAAPSSSRFLPTAMELAKAATTAVKGAYPAMQDASRRSGLSHEVTKAELRPGSHIYVWKQGYTYSHHGIVVHVEACQADCQHHALECCAVVHFLPPGSGQAGCIELVSLSSFAGSGSVCKCRYSVPQTEFYLKRAGMCSTKSSDVWPVVVLRALSIVEFEASADIGVDTSSAAASDSRHADLRVEYNLLNKNSELLARWCKLGLVSGVRRFRSSEVAFSPQSAPGRFVRLGLVAAVPVVGVAAAASAGTTIELPAGAVAAGSLAASDLVRSVLLDVVRHPQEMVNMASQMMAGASIMASGALAQSDSSSTSAARPWSVETERRRREEVSDAISVALRACFADLGVIVPKPLTPLLDSARGCAILCEVLVDLLEAAAPENAFSCAAHVQEFIDNLML